MLTRLLAAILAVVPALAQYPAHWWAPAPEEGKPEWEILPQAAKPGEVILSKRNELGILSNFAATPFTFRGKRYGSVEGFWQMMLYPESPRDPRATASGIVWKHTRAEVAKMTGFEAKDAGTLAEESMRRMGIDWVTFEGRRITYRTPVKGEHYRLIVEAMRAKLAQNPKVREILLATGKLVLRPDHIQEPDAPPEWQYFQIWMELRGELSR
ncbi:MAG TPA: NADAR family protein [Verrucomicrobiae bacterium]|nr:NADAR family protein [Verrucomicrobiae bacterium]